MSGSEGGFAESESPVVLASRSPEMETSAVSFDGGIGGVSWDDGAAAPALESLLRLLATMIARFGRGSSDKFTMVSIESSSNNSQY